MPKRQNANRSSDSSLVILRESRTSWSRRRNDHPSIDLELFLGEVGCHRTKKRKRKRVSPPSRLLVSAGDSGATLTTLECKIPLRDPPPFLPPQCQYFQSPSRRKSGEAFGFALRFVSPCFCSCSSRHNVASATWVQ